MSCCWSFLVTSYFTGYATKKKHRPSNVTCAGCESLPRNNQRSATNALCTMNRVAADRHCGFFHCFAECRVRVDCAGEVFSTAAVFHMSDG